MKVAVEVNVAVERLHAVAKLRKLLKLAPAIGQDRLPKAEMIHRVRKVRHRRVQIMLITPSLKVEVSRHTVHLTGG